MIAVPVPFDWVPGPEDAPALLLCDHASAVMPDSLNHLGLDMANRFAHIAWDIGAAELTCRMAQRLHCPALLCGISRLVTDVNRAADDPSAIPSVSGGIAVPGNNGLSMAQRQQRLSQWFYPYHEQISTYLDRHPACRAVIGIHSFTPHLPPEPPRPWHIGVLWTHDGRLAQPLLTGLRAQPGLVVGDNQPYSAHSLNYTLDTHAAARGLASVAVEIRQDTLCSSAAVRDWADRLSPLLTPLLQGLSDHD